MPGISATDANGLVSAEVRNTPYVGSASLWISLHTADPGSAGSSEVVGGGYARQAIAFGVPVAGQAASTNAVTFTNLPAGRFTHIALWDAATGGVCRQSGALVPDLTTNAGQNLTLNIGTVTYTVVAT